MMNLLINDFKIMFRKKSFLLSVVVASPLMILLFNTATFAISYATFLSCIFAFASIAESPFFSKEKVCFALTLSGTACLVTALFAAAVNHYLHATPDFVLVETGAKAILFNGLCNFLALTIVVALAYPVLTHFEKRRPAITR